MAVIAYLIGGSHDLTKISIDHPRGMIEMLGEEAGPTLLAFPPHAETAIAVVERYFLDCNLSNGSYAYVFVRNRETTNHG